MEEAVESAGEGGAALDGPAEEDSRTGVGERDEESWGGVAARDEGPGVGVGEREELERGAGEEERSRPVGVAEVEGSAKGDPRTAGRGAEELG